MGLLKWFAFLPIAQIFPKYRYVDVITKFEFSKNSNYPSIAQLRQNFMYIEIIKVFRIYEIIAYNKPIHAPYRIFLLDVKSWSWQMRVSSNKKGKSIGSDSPSWVVIRFRYPKWFWLCYSPSHGWDWGLGFLSKNDDITSFRGSLKVLISWRYQRF